jgi:hypothetical protein
MIASTCTTTFVNRSKNLPSTAIVSPTAVERSKSRFRSIVDERALENDSAGAAVYVGFTKRGEGGAVSPDCWTCIDLGRTRKETVKLKPFREAAGMPGKSPDLGVAASPPMTSWLPRFGHPTIQQKVVFLNLDISTTTPSNLVKFCM